MRRQREGGHEQQQDGGAVLGVAVDLARHPHQPQEPRRLEQADEGGGLQTEGGLRSSSGWPPSTEGHSLPALLVAAMPSVLRRRGEGADPGAARQLVQSTTFPLGPAPGSGPGVMHPLTMQPLAPSESGR